MNGNIKHLYDPKDYDIADFENLDLSEEDFAAFGHYIMARLVAIRKTQSR